MASWWKWFGVRIVSITTRTTVLCDLIAKNCTVADQLSQRLDQKIFAVSEKGKTMANRKVVAYAVDVDTGRIVWTLWERKDNA